MSEIVNEMIVLGVGLTDDDRLIKKKKGFAYCQQIPVNDNKQSTALAAIAPMLSIGSLEIIRKNLPLLA